MGKFDNYLLVSDFDGTLLNSYKKISDKNKEAISYFVSNGGVFCGASGRTQYNIAPFTDGLPITVPWILYNGAVIYDFNTEEFVHMQVIDKEPIKNTIEKLLIIYPTLCVQIYTKKALFLINKHGKRDYHIESENQTFIYCDIDKIAGEWIKVLLHDDYEVLNKINSSFNTEEFNSTYNRIFSTSTYLELININVSKATAMVKLKNMIDTKNRKIIAIGDFFNDYDMIRNADIGAAPENAPEEIKRVAKIITTSNDRHAIYDLIHKI